MTGAGGESAHRVTTELLRENEVDKPQIRQHGGTGSTEVRARAQRRAGRCGGFVRL